jgi:hypothetical protein
MRFLASHFHNGSWYALQINADSLSDAQEICRRHSLRLDGEHKFTLRWPFGLIARKFFR